MPKTWSPPSKDRKVFPLGRMNEVAYLLAQPVQRCAPAPNTVRNRAPAQNPRALCCRSPGGPNVESKSRIRRALFTQIRPLLRGRSIKQFECPKQFVSHNQLNTKS